MPAGLLLGQHPVPIAQIREQPQNVEDRHRHGHRPVAAAVAVVVDVKHARDGIDPGEIRRRRPDGQDRFAVGEARIVGRLRRAGGARRRDTRSGK